MHFEATDQKQNTAGIVFGHMNCQTKNAKWLCLEDMHDKFYRPHSYDIGGTYLENLPDYWFACSVEQIGDIFLLHLFVQNSNEGSFKVSVSQNSNMTLDKKNNTVFLSKLTKEHNFIKKDCMEQSYLSTYSFTEYDIELLKDRKLYITVSFPKDDDISCNTVAVARDFKELLDNPIGSDFIIQSMEGEEFNVHKIILASQSDVFKAMLKKDTAESLSNFVKLSDVGTNELRCLLEFIYTGTVNNLPSDNLLNLIIAAEKYDLQGLKQLLEHCLQNQLSVESAIEILRVADMISSDELKMATMKFIKRNPKVMKSVSLKDINNMDLLRELCQFGYNEY